jgi:hypothetical protein
MVPERSNRVSDNTFSSTAPHSIGVDDRTPNWVVPAQVVNNTFQNVTTPVNAQLRRRPPFCSGTEYSLAAAFGNRRIGSRLAVFGGG